MEMFIAGDPAAMGRRETFERYRCAQHFHTVVMSPVAEPCSRLLHSLSAILHDGALREYGLAHPTPHADDRCSLCPARSLPLRPTGLAER